MALYARSTVVDAPFERVWDFHSQVSGLEALTPSWMGLVVESVERPLSGPGNTLIEGSTVTVSLRPFGFIPAGRWVSVITKRERRGNTAMFRDEMIEGPLPLWVHTHRFTKVDGGTRITDRIAYRMPDPVPSALALPGFAAMFAYRHHRTKVLLS